MPRGWVEAGRTVDARRALLGLSVKQLARNAGVDARTVADLIHARRVSFTDTTLANLERALAWRQGAILGMIEGKEPEDEEGLAEIVAAWPRLSAEVREVLRRIVEGR
jgi:transcriptional regulator with XRE-family HTH domain